MKYLIPLFIILFSCQKHKENVEINPPNWIRDIAPIQTNAVFYGNEKYGYSERHEFDLFMPENVKGLTIIVHGGGFVSYDKSLTYSQPLMVTLIDSLISNDIAVMNISYRLIEPTDTIGVIKSLKDVERALNYANDLHKYFKIKKNDIILLGGSAGAGASLWVGLQHNIKGVVTIQPQATYNVLGWGESVFSEYPQINSQSITQIIGANFLNQFYRGADSLELDMMQMFTPNHAEIYVECFGIENTLPTNQDRLYHHPLHGKAILDNGYNVTANIPELGIFANENILEFIKRKL